MAASASADHSGCNDLVLGQSRTPIHFAALQGQLHALHGLIKLGESVNSRTVDGVTPLHEACSAGNVYCARMLIKAGAEVNARNVDGSTPLCDAACPGSLECINLLLESGATVNDPLARSSPLHEAALRDHSHAVARLMEAGCNLEASDGHFGTPLHAACYRGNVASALCLLIAEANVNATMLHESPLHMAAAADSPLLVRLWVEFGVRLGHTDNRNKRRWTGANVNATKLHESPLHMAAAADSPLLVRLLLEFGARLGQRDNRNRRPMDRARPGSETRRLLRAYECEVLSLQDTCRMVIYRHTKRGRLKDLSDVGLPVPIMDKLLHRGSWVASA